MITEMQGEIFQKRLGLERREKTTFLVLYSFFIKILK